MLVRLRNLIPCKANLMLYKTSILPHLTYCHLVWKFCKSFDSRKIERIQERALRTVYKSQTETYEELLTSAKLPKTQNRRLQDTAILMYKVKYGITPRYVSELFTIKSTHQRLKKVILNYPALIQWPMGGTRCATNSLGQRSVMSSET